MFVNNRKTFFRSFTASDTRKTRARGEGETRRIYYTNPRLLSTRVVLIEIDVNKLVPVSTSDPVKRKDNYNFYNFSRHLNYKAGKAEFMLRVELYDAWRRLWLYCWSPIENEKCDKSLFTARFEASSLSLEWIFNSLAAIRLDSESLHVWEPKRCLRADDNK